MGKSEERSSVKTERVSPPRVQHSQELTFIHLYPDWATVKAFYSNGPPPLQQPYFNSIVTDGYIPPHARSWTPPQSFIPLYGLPYPAAYSQGFVYAHPALPLAATPFSEGSLSKTAEKTDRGSTKKLRRLDGDAVPRGSYSAELEAKASVHDCHDMSQSVGIDASSDGSNGKSGAHQSECNYPTASSGQVHVQANTIPECCIEVPVGPEILENDQVQIANGKVEPTKVCATEGLPFEVRVKEERHLKRERRKQANRESARRSRLRKQAEYETLMETYESLKVKNLALKSELNQLIEDRDRLKLENAAFMKKLNNSWAGQPTSPVQDQTISKSNHPKSADADELCQLNNLHVVRVKEEKVHADLKNTLLIQLQRPNSRLGDRLIRELMH